MRRTRCVITSRDAGRLPSTSSVALCVLEWVALAMATVFLIVVTALGEAVRRTVRPNWLSAAADEGLMIVGWVAMWRPVDLLLYEPRTHRREIALFRRLQDMDVRVVEQSSDLNVPDSLDRPGNTHQ